MSFGPPKKISAVKGTVSKSRRIGVQIEFTHEGKKGTAELNSGLAYLNGSRMLVDVCKTSNEMALLLPKGTPVTFDAQVRGRNFYEVTLMWVGQQPMANVTENLQKRLDWVRKTMVVSSSSEKQASPPFPDDQPWFVKVLQLPSPSAGLGLPQPDDAESVGLDGVVKALHRPTGGVVELDGGEKVFFHRARVFLDGEQLSPLGDLLDKIPVGTKVKVDYLPNKVLLV